MIYHDPDTGQQFARSFNAAGQYMAAGWDEGTGNGQHNNGAYRDPREPAHMVDSADFGRGLGQQFAAKVLQAHAIEPDWMVATVQGQRLNFARKQRRNPTRQANQIHHCYRIDKGFHRTDGGYIGQERAMRFALGYPTGFTRLWPNRLGCYHRRPRGSYG